MTRKQQYEVAIVQAWNARFPVGTEVVVKMDSGQVWIARTRSIAQMLGAEPSRNNPGHTAVIWLCGFAGCYSLARVKPAGVYGWNEELRQLRNSLARVNRGEEGAN
jgi:hypothetical protein